MPPFLRSARLRRVLLGLAALLLPLAALAWGVQHLRQLRAELEQPLENRAALAYVGSNSCRSCHQDHHASWYQTFHRTMTQEATAKTVQGAFDGQVVEYWGQPVRPRTTEDGRAVFDYLHPQTREVMGTAEVRRTVGSHRYQQYLAQVPGQGGNYTRLHLLWHAGDQRWVHINGAFLYDDAQGFNDHIATWNHNCIFCHNTGPQPRIQNAEALYQRLYRGERFNFLDEARYDSQVAELGIACESCHGPGEAHARKNRDPLRRNLLALSDRPDPTIVNPARLPPERASEVCGQCHGQRLPVRTDLVETWLDSGPTYRPGEVLAEHVRLVRREEPGPPGRPDLYRLRFWEDGTPRLSAYEMQGHSASPCTSEGQASCQTCHAAHGGDVNGMMREGAREGAPCLACHQAVAADIPAHTRHAADSSGSVCVDCHMPKAVYGVMEIHRSHRIEVPQPARHAALNRPDACTNCHLDRSADWAQTAIDAWRGGSPAPAGDGQPARNLLQLLGGDPVERAIAAKMAGRADAAPMPAADRVPGLLAALDDDYPAVRRFAAHSLRDLARRTPELAPLAEPLEDYDFIAEPAAREAIEQALQQRWQSLPASASARPLPVAEVSRLRAEAQTKGKNIEIGE